MNVLVYGAYGYSGGLIVERMLKCGLKPIVSGRDVEKTNALGDKHGLTSRPFSLDDARAAYEALEGVKVVLHCAGPFVVTSKAMVEACLARGASYLDITGELGVIERVIGRNADAKREGVLLIPGVGFDVVPTDCLAVMLRDALPDATHLTLAFRTKGGPSRGTARTAVMGLGQSSAERKDGVIVEVPQAKHVRDIPFPSGTRQVASIPWGDVSSAYHSTKIPNIVTMMAMHPNQTKMMKTAATFAVFARNRMVQKALIALVDARVKGPDEDGRANGFVEVWGEVKNASGKTVTGTLRLPEGYTFTSHAAVRAVEETLKSGATGAMSPAMAFGKDFLRTIEGSEIGPLVESHA